LKTLREKMQKRATKMLPGLRKVPYPERLKKLGLPTHIEGAEVT